MKIVIQKETIPDSRRKTVGFNKLIAFRQKSRGVFINCIEVET